MKKLLTLILITLLTFSLTSCSGYNLIMQTHLSDKDNYERLDFTVVEIYFYDTETSEIVTDTKNERIGEHPVTFRVKANESFGGKSTDGITELELHSVNNEHVAAAGFYDVFTPGDTVTLTVSDFKYLGDQMYFIAGIEYKDTVYLDFETGLSRIERFMKKNPSLF